MKAVNRKTLKDISSKKASAGKLLITQADKWVLALQYKHISIPLMFRNTLAVVVAEAERVAAARSMVVEHQLNRPVALTFKYYRIIEDEYAFTMRTSMEFASIYSAYMYLRAFGVERKSGCYVKELDEKRVEISGSHDCTLYRALENLMKCVTPEKGLTGECPRCLTRFVTLTEVGGVTLCLDCGYEN